MKISKLIPLFVLFFLMTSARLKAQTVYITDTGKKYHAKNCSLAKTGKKGIELAEAKKQGYEACKNCKVEPAATEPKKTKEATKTGAK